jgi:hypothetical protein
MFDIVKHGLVPDIDRARKRTGRTSSGVEGIGMQDGSIQERMGPVPEATNKV